MADLPILFSAPMVRALLDGRKTQTRRVLKLDGMLDPMPDVWEAKEIDGVWYFGSDHPDCGGRLRAPVRFRRGDRLYVREHWRTESKAYDDLKPSEMDADYPLILEADGDWKSNKTVGRFRQGMHMPRWASRLTLTVTDVRVQRLQECSRADALAEGVEMESADPPFYYVPGIHPHSLTAVGVEEHGGRHAERSYAKLWDHINGAGSWAANPWIVALTFTVERRNIDAARAA